LHLNHAVLAIFVLVYGFLCLSKHHKAKAIWIGIGLMVLCRALMPGDDPEGRLAIGYVFAKSINWNVIGILAGAMLLAELFIDSKVPVLLADVLAAHCKSTVTALLGVCLLSGFVSIFVDNVTTVLIVAPVALIIAKRTKISPVPFLIGMAVSSNLQGAATLIGDPPSMLLADHFDLTFNDFFLYKPAGADSGKLSMFFIMQAGAVTSLVVLYFFFRPYRRPMAQIEAEKPTSWAPTCMIGIMVAHLAVSSVLDPEFVWLAGTGNVVLALLGLAWAAKRNGGRVKGLLKRYDYPTIFFLAGIFVVAGAMNDFGWIAYIVDGVTAVVGGNRFIAFSFIVWFSVIVSGFIDNIAYIALMLPVAGGMAESPALGGSPFLYAAGLLVGSCLGGNITPFGAACNVVAVGILRREGHHISFWDFARIGLPFTVAATAAGWITTWLIWG